MNAEARTRLRRVAKNELERVIQHGGTVQIPMSPESLLALLDALDATEDNLAEQIQVSGALAADRALADALLEACGEPHDFDPKTCSDEKCYRAISHSDAARAYAEARKEAG